LVSLIPKYAIAGRLTLFELVEREETVNHGSIVTVGGRGQHDKDHEEVETPQVAPLEPCDGGELLPGDLEEAGSGRGIVSSGATHDVDVCLVVLEAGVGAVNTNEGLFEAGEQKKERPQADI
jgi:hypothetical protein